ncbi:hypothetical protein KY348_03700, partial [Candidatus Woesearchaeota archaeon]|nr:hypothetical protein [Candidatus Woesearchaeota archaeon]
MKLKNIIRFLTTVLMLICISLSVSSVDCDCHPGGTQNRVCLFTEPTNIQLSGDTFDFDIKIRNFYRTVSGASITDITTSVVSCNGPQGACTWTGSNSDFSISINPSVIASSQAGVHSPCGTTPEQCRDCNTGRVETVNSQITINDAPDGTYTIRYRVGWQPKDRERFIDVTISFTSNGCIPDCVGKECGGDGCGGSCGSCSG